MAICSPRSGRGSFGHFVVMVKLVRIKLYVLDQGSFRGKSFGNQSTRPASTPEVQKKDALKKKGIGTNTQLLVAGWIELQPPKLKKVCASQGNIFFREQLVVTFSHVRRHLATLQSAMRSQASAAFDNKSKDLMVRIDLKYLSPSPKLPPSSLHREWMRMFQKKNRTTSWTSAARTQVTVPRFLGNPSA